MRLHRCWGLAVAIPLAGSGCLVAAAGAGAGGAIYVSDRGAESVVPATVASTESAAQRVFQELGIKETKTSSEQSSGEQKRVLEGSTDDRDVTVTIASEGSGSKVVVVARKSAVTWDKDLAKAVLEKIVSQAK
jgi:hypothetical protein